MSEALEEIEELEQPVEEGEDWEDPQEEEFDPFPDEEEAEEVPEEEVAAEDPEYEIKIKGEITKVKQSELAEVFGLKETPMTQELANVLVGARQKELAGLQAIADSGRVQKQFRTFVEILKSNPMEILMEPELGIDFPKLAEDYIIEQLKLEQMHPSERELLKIRQENEKLKKMDSQAREQQAKAQFEQETERYTHEYAQDIATAIDEAGLPKEKLIFNRISYHMQEQYKETGTVPPARSVLPIVEQELEGVIQAYGQTKPPEAIQKALGTNGVKKLREAEIAKFKKQPAPPKTDEFTEAPKKGRVQMSPAEFREYMKKFNK
jgi:hypothetical protein